MIYKTKTGMARLPIKSVFEIIHPKNLHLLYKGISIQKQCFIESELMKKYNF